MAGIGVGAKNCSDGADDLEDSRKDLENYYEQKYKGYQCALSGKCNPSTNLERANQDYKHHLEKAAEGVSAVGSSIPGSSLTGPPPMSVDDVLIYGSGNVYSEIK